MMPQRRALLDDWLRETLGSGDYGFSPASGDASFRSYWRVRHGGKTYVVMDAPPGLEDIERFVRISRQ